MAGKQNQNADAVEKIVIEITVLARTGDVAAVQALAHADDGLAQIAEQIESGPLIARVAVRESIPVPPAVLKAELAALGNDGSFFDRIGQD